MLITNHGCAVTQDIPTSVCGSHTQALRQLEECQCFFVIFLQLLIVLDVSSETLYFGCSDFTFLLRRQQENKLFRRIDIVARLRVDMLTGHACNAKPHPNGMGTNETTSHGRRHIMIRHRKVTQTRSNEDGQLNQERRVPQYH